MTVSKKSIIKSSAAHKPTATKAPKSTTGVPTVPAGRMVTAMRMAKNAKLARIVIN